MLKAKTIPTIFATSVAEAVGLLPKGMDTLPDEEKFIISNPELRLIAFQQMAIATTFEEAMLAYHGVKLQDHQEVALKLIYRSTVPWLIGHVVSELIDASGTKASAEFILTQLIKEGKVDKSVAKELLVKMKVVDPNKVLTKHEGDENVENKDTETT